MLTSGEVVGLACMRDVIDDEIKDLSTLEVQLANDIEDEDFEDVGMAAFYLNVANDYLRKIFDRHDEMPTQPTKKEKVEASTDLVLAAKGENLYVLEPKKEEELVDKKITDMTIQEIGEGTVLFDPDGEAWVVELWQNQLMDLKQGRITKTSVKPADLSGWTFNGKTWGEKLNDLISEVSEEYPDASIGFQAGEVVKRDRCYGNPLQVIRAVNKATQAA